MSRINLGGRMPDGSEAMDFWTEPSNFVCAAGAELSESPSKLKWGMLGKLCLTRSALLMLPYEGAMLQAVQKIATELRKSVLGPYAKMAEALAKLGLYPKGPQVLDQILVWPLTAMDANAKMEEQSFLGIRGGARLDVRVKGKPYYLFMSAKERQRANFASAKQFRDAINSLRGR
jgi:hypothetical protein